MRKVLTLSAVILLVGCIITFIFLGFTSKKSKPVDLLPLVREEVGADNTGSEIEAYDSLHIEEAELSLVNKENRLSWELVMKTMVEDPEGYFLSDIQGEYFPVKGEAFQIAAEEGRMSKDFSELYLFGQITISRFDIRLTARELRWSTQSEKIQFEKEVHLERDGVEIDTEFMLADPNLEQIEIKGNSKWKFMN